MDRIGDRMKVLEVFLASEEHHTAAGWQSMLQDQGVDLAPEFVANTLELLTRYGLAERRSFDGAPPRYEHRHLDEHHDHLICTRCGSITEFNNPELESLQEKVTREAGFHPLRHRLQIYGLCQKCRASREPCLPLTMCSPGEKVRLVSLQGGEKLSRQLSDMGLPLGGELEVISTDGGPMVVACKGCRLALGRGVAHKCMVTPCLDNENK